MAVPSFNQSPLPPGSATRTGVGGFGTSGSHKAGNMVEVVFANKVSAIGRIKQHMAGLKTQGARLEHEVARRVAETARDLVAVDEGKTRDSIRLTRRDGHWAVMADRLGERPEVAIYLEIGTYKMAARPYMRPAADLVTSAAGLGNVVRTIGGLIVPIRGQGF